MSRTVSLTEGADGWLVVSGPGHDERKPSLRRQDRPVQALQRHGLVLRQGFLGRLAISGLVGAVSGCAERVGETCDAGACERPDDQGLLQVVGRMGARW